MEPEEHLKQIRTFEGDVAEAIKNQNESLVSIQRAAAAKREAAGTPEGEGKGGHRALILAVLTLVLAALGGSGLYWAYGVYKEKTAPPPVEIPENQLISAVNVVEVDASTLSRQALIGVTAIERSRERQASSITQVELRRGTPPDGSLLTTEDFLTRLNTHAPSPLIRAYGDSFMLGVLGSDPAHVFLIIPVESFAIAFPGMLEWEPRMAEDLLAFFADNTVVERVPTSTVWTDRLVENRDTRVLNDADGETALIYGFFENNLLIVTDSAETFATLAERLETQKLRR